MFATAPAAAPAHAARRSDQRCRWHKACCATCSTAPDGGGFYFTNTAPAAAPVHAARSSDQRWRCCRVWAWGWQVSAAPVGCHNSHAAHMQGSLCKPLQLLSLVTTCAPDAANNWPGSSWLAALGRPLVTADGKAVKRTRPGRQTISDKKWEGHAWITPHQLAKAVDKRSRWSAEGRSGEGRSGEGPALAADPALAANPALSAAPPPHAPPRPADPVVEERRRDKDRIPSRVTWVWDENGEAENSGPSAAGAWVLRPRPKVLQVGPFYSYNAIPDKQLCLLNWLVDAKRADDGMPVLNLEFLVKTLVPRLERVAGVSLRLIDWLVVDYAREHNIAYKRYFPSEKATRVVVVYRQYTQWLMWWRRRHYDVFRRRHRIYFDGPSRTYSTTVAQLHFFYMADQYGFLEYAELHREAIQAHMQATLSTSTAAKARAKAAGHKFSRAPLVGKSTSSAYAMHAPTTIFFGCAADEGDEDDEENENSEAEDTANEDSDSDVEMRST
jgi:hypothetical protein